MGTITSLAQIKQGTTGNNFPAVTNKGMQDLFKVQQFRLAIDQRNHIDAKYVLHHGLLVEIVQNNFGYFTTTQLDNDTHAVLIGFIAQFCDAIKFFVFYQLGNFFKQASLVNLVRQLGNDQRVLAVSFVGFHMGFGAHINAATTGVVSLMYTLGAVDNACCREIRSRQMLHDATDIQFGIFNQGDGGIDDFIDIMRRYIGSHTNSDTGGAIDQQPRNTGWKNQWFVFGFIVVRAEIDRFLVEVGQEFVGQLGHANFCITHGRCGITINRTKVTLAIDQHVAHRKRLCHADNGVIHGGITMWMVFTNNITHHSGGFFIGFVPVVAQYTHSVKYAPVNRFQAIPDIG